MDFIPYLGFNGNCREAFGFYKNLFGGEIDKMITYGEIPECEERQMSDADRDKVMHAALRVGDGLLYGGDAPGGHSETAAGYMVTISLPDIAEGERVFNALAEGGQVQMPYAEAFWVEKFGMATDRFGTPWAINGGAPADL